MNSCVSQTYGQCEKGGPKSEIWRVTLQCLKLLPVQVEWGDVVQPSQRNQHTHKDAHYGSTFQQCNQWVDFPLWALYQRYDTSVKDINWFLMVTLGDLSIGPPAKSPHYNDSVRSLIPLMSPHKTWCCNNARLSMQMPRELCVLRGYLFFLCSGFGLFGLISNFLRKTLSLNIISRIRYSRDTWFC